MNSNLKHVNVKSLTGNVFRFLDDDWMVISAGSKEKFNSMTASWGTFGILWNKPIAIGFVRPQRYTFDFLNNYEYYTLSFYPEKFKDALNIFGNCSGRDVDKVQKSGLHPTFTDKGNVYYEEAWLVFECKKLYVDDIKSDSFIDKKLIANIYPKQDFHRFFIGEIVNCLATDHFLNGKHEELKPNIDGLPTDF